MGLLIRGEHRLSLKMSRHFSLIWLYNFLHRGEVAYSSGESCGIVQLLPQVCYVAVHRKMLLDV
jgi:hypothetical protein